MKNGRHTFGLYKSNMERARILLINDIIFTRARSRATEFMSIFLAFALALCAPGAGQLYNGDFGRAAIFGGTFLFLQPLAAPLLVRLFRVRKLKSVITLAQWSNSLLIAVIFISVADAVYFSWLDYAGFWRVSWTGLVSGGFFAVCAGFCYRGLMASPYPDMIAGLEGFAALIRPVKKDGRNI